MAFDLRRIAEERGIPLRTLEQVKADLEQAKRTKADKALARVMVKFGRLTDNARAYARDYLGGEG
jgi:uncharacterized membrane protein